MVGGFRRFGAVDVLVRRLVRLAGAGCGAGSVGCGATEPAESPQLDLAEARRLFAQMGVTGWDDYTRSIET